MKSFRMKIAAGSMPPAITRPVAYCELISPSWYIITKIGTIAAVPVTTLDSSNSTYSNASRPGMRTRDNAYAAHAASTVVTAMASVQRMSEFTSEVRAYGCWNVVVTLSRVQSGHRRPSPGLLSNGALASHSMGTAKNASTTAKKAVYP